MKIKVTLNGKIVQEEIKDDTLLIDFLRKHNCFSVKRACETSNCGACSIILNGKIVLSCGILAARANGGNIETLEGLQNEAKEFIDFIANEGAEQCGFCNPGYVISFIALMRENKNPTDEEIKEYLAGNLCRCSGYIGQLRGFRKFLDSKNNK